MLFIGKITRGESVFVADLVNKTHDRSMCCITLMQKDNCAFQQHRPQILQQEQSNWAAALCVTGTDGPAGAVIGCLGVSLKGDTSTLSCQFIRSTQLFYLTGIIINHLAYKMS